MKPLFQGGGKSLVLHFCIVSRRKFLKQAIFSLSLLMLSEFPLISCFIILLELLKKLLSWPRYTSDLIKWYPDFIFKLVKVILKCTILNSFEFEMMLRLEFNPRKVFFRFRDFFCSYSLLDEKLIGKRKILVLRNWIGKWLFRVIWVEGIYSSRGKGTPSKWMSLSKAYQ